MNNAGDPGRRRVPRRSRTSRSTRSSTRTCSSVLHATRAFLPGMLERGRGHVVNVASLAGRFATPGAAVYTATKHGVVAFSESLDYDADGRGVLRHDREPRSFVATEGFPQSTLPPVARPEGRARRRRDREGRARGHRARVLDPAVARAAAGVPRPHAAAVPVGRADASARRQAVDAGASHEHRARASSTGRWPTPWSSPTCRGS